LIFPPLRSQHKAQHKGHLFNIGISSLALYKHNNFNKKSTEKNKFNPLSDQFLTGRNTVNFRDILLFFATNLVK
jgi:hypothetical protein